MTPPLSGLLAGLLFGALSVALMLPLPFPDKRRALAAAFLDRLAIGLVIGCVQLPYPGWAIGAFFGFLLSLPSALVTRAHIPIILIGTLGGLAIGGFIHGWAPP